MTGLAFVMMAKAPVAGQVKTRLCPPLSATEAAEAAEAFLLDTFAAVRAAAESTGGVAVLARVGELAAFPEALADAEHFAQAGADLGARIDHVAATALAAHKRVVIVGADMPGLPPANLETAAAALSESDAVVGPSADGGYYLIGFSRHEHGLLADLPWSAADTGAATLSRLRERGYSVASVPPFDDVDDGEALAALEAALAAGAIEAPHTAAWLRGRAGRS